MKLFVSNVQSNARHDSYDEVEPLPDPEPLVGEAYFPIPRSKPMSRLDMIAEALGHDASDMGNQFEEMQDGSDAWDDDGPDGEPLDLFDESEVL